jgi:hypothetical protein
MPSIAEGLKHTHKKDFHLLKHLIIATAHFCIFASSTSKQYVFFLFLTFMCIEGSVFWNVTLHSFKQTQHVGRERLSSALFLARLTPDNEDAAVL